MPRCRATTRPTAAVVLVVVLVALSVGTRAPAHPAPGDRAPIVPATSACPGSLLPHNYSGTVALNSVSAGSSIPLRYSYDAVVTTNLTDGVVLSSVCTGLNGTVTPASSGSFGLSIDAAANVSCTFPGGAQAGTCVTTSGPYELVDVAPSTSVPPGYVPAVTENGTNFSVNVYSDLARVTLAPGGAATTVSPGATDAFRATSWTGDGTVTPLSPQYYWALAGTGWTFVGTPAGSSVNITAAPGAGIGNLSVVASAQVVGGSLVSTPASVQLAQQPTDIASASLNRTAVDVGQSIGVVVSATGAAGYNYSASVTPGLGAATVDVTCATDPGAAGSVALSCPASFHYATTGVAQPVLTLTNGASSSSWSFPPVTVTPAPAVVFEPGAPVGYANESLAVGVEAGAGTGTAPFARACFDPGVGAVECDTGGGPLWTFHPVYANPGRYSVSAWIVDATGTNRSATAMLVVVDPPRIVLAAPPDSVSAGTPVALVGTVEGGVLPAQIWWNASGAAGTIATNRLTQDGPVSATFDPATTGLLTVTVTLVDAAGTTTGTSETFLVGAGAATSVALAAAPAASGARVGSPLAIDWQAVDAAGLPVRAFSALAEIELAVPGASGAAPGWVNASGAGPLPSPVPGWFNVPDSAWLAGGLNVTVTVRASGPVVVELTLANGFAASSDAVPIQVAPDVDHLRLLDPVTVLATPRANDTLWQVTDRFGNPAVGASVVTTESFGGSSAATLLPVRVEPDGATEVWVNYSAPGSGAGTVTVTDLAGDALLPPIVVPAVANPWTALLPDLVMLVTLGSVAFVGAGLLLRSRGRWAAGFARAEREGDELQRMAEGRAALIELVRRTGPVDLAGVAALWEPPPAPPELADWLASLLTDGTFDAEFAPDGTARFALAPGPPTSARVTVDVGAFDVGQERRDAARAEWEDDDR